MKSKEQGQTSHRLPLTTHEGKCMFAIDQIIRLRSESNYTYVYFSDRRPLLVAKVLQEFENLLKPLGFVRIHRSHLVNQKHVTAIDDAGRVWLSDQTSAAISRRKKREVSEILLPSMSAA